MAQGGTKRITLKDAIRMWEERGECPLEEVTELKLNGWYPPIEKLDNSTASIPKCEKLSLSTNMIERLANLNPLKCLRVLSVSRNYLKSLAGVEVCADTLQEIWASYNLIEKPSKGVTNCKKLRVLYLANNWIKDWSEVSRLSECPELDELVLVGNPLEEKFTGSGASAAEWQKEVSKKLLQIRRLDGWNIVRTEDEPEETEEA
ncbi:unnamed protein product [Orchesella dallaii]|uniref:Dynein light chain 1, axonemal n=1 Tax=Orchesella dallaii TaxID=48710 RepID=A0ABP1RDY7_9HEXA